MVFSSQRDGASAMYVRLLQVLILVLTTRGNAQVFYSTNPNYLKSKAEKNNLISSYQSAYPDTSIIELSNFFPVNFMGNMGLPSPDYLLRYGTENIGFRFYQTPFFQDRFHESQVEYFKSTGPYADLTGVAGSKQLQVFKLLFTHTFKEIFNIALKLHRYTSLGFYLKQQTYTNNFFITNNYTTTNKRLGYYFYFMNNGNKNQENGGIDDRVLNDSTAALDKILLRVRLSAASRDNRETKVMFNPWLRLNKRNDSLQLAGHYIQIKSRFSNNSYKYRDAGIKDDEYYALVFLDTVQTIDSAHVRQYINEINYTTLSSNGQKGFSAGYKNEISQVWQKRDSLALNHIVQADLVFGKSIAKKDTAVKKMQSFENHFNVQYVLNGSNNGDYKIENRFMFSFDPKKKRGLFLNILAERRHPDYIYNNWISNHFQWQNNGYKPQDQLQLKAGIDFGKYLHADVFYQNIFNYLYFDNEALPGQYKNTIQNTGASVSYTGILFKHLGLSLSYAVQSTSHPAHVRLPSSISTAKLFYAGNLFNKTLQLQTGTQLRVYGSFDAYGYMPATQAFYLQDSFKTSTYPYLDVYLNARIRPVSIFLKVENALHGFVGNNYALVAGYYQPDLAFRFGINWVFFD